MRNVFVTYHQEDDSWWAESPDVQGFTAVGSTFAETRKLANEGLQFYLEDENVRLIERIDDGAFLSVGPFTPEPLIPEVHVATVVGGYPARFRDDVMSARQVEDLAIA